MNRELLTLADQELSTRTERFPHYLKDIERILDWKRINKLLSQIDRRRESVCGRDSYSPEVMFRIMLLQRWYKLSDYQMEEQLYMNIMFLQFCHFSLNHPVPDHSTISRWRSRFTEKSIFEKLLVEINRQLESYNLTVHEGVILDATLVASQARPRRKEIIETEPVGDEEIPGKQTFQATELTVEESKDSDARWVKKGNKSIYGYKGHVAVDKENGLVQAVIVTPANVYDGHMLPELVEAVNPADDTEVLADKGYCSAENNDYLKDKNLTSKIMGKKKKGKVPDPAMIEHNHEISQERYRIERSFGSLKKHYGWDRSIYIGLQKTRDYLLMGAMAFNLKRFLVLLR